MNNNENAVNCGDGVQETGSGNKPKYCLLTLKEKML